MTLGHREREERELEDGRDRRKRARDLPANPPRAPCLRLALPLYDPAQRGIYSTVQYTHSLSPASVLSKPKPKTKPIIHPSRPLIPSISIPLTISHITIHSAIPPLGIAISPPPHQPLTATHPPSVGHARSFRPYAPRVGGSSGRVDCTAALSLGTYLHAVQYVHFSQYLDLDHHSPVGRLVGRSVYLLPSQASGVFHGRTYRSSNSVLCAAGVFGGAGCFVSYRIVSHRIVRSSVAYYQGRTIVCSL